jgi:protoheme IX farnesyltransferase
LNKNSLEIQINNNECVPLGPPFILEEIQTEIATPSLSIPLAQEYSKAQAYIKLTKFRLSFLVVLSAVISYFTLAESIDIVKMIAVIVGGFLVTGAANGFNQVIERNLDKLMTRTGGRPLPQNVLTVNQALVFCFIFLAGGIFVLSYFVNILSGILGALSVVLYALVYTPLKRKTPFSVFVGAFPGAIPTLIGSVAASEGFGEFSFPAWILFGVQFMWQFPHFWAIAWVSHDDYAKAGFFMLPSLGGRDKSSAFQIVIYTLFLIPVSLLPQIFGIANMISGIFVLIFGLFFLAQALTLYLRLDIASARKLMFGSFLYLPLVQLCIMFGALWK